MGNRIVKTGEGPDRGMGVEGSESGFTLIELVVVLTLMGAMLFVALPKFGVPSLRDDSRHAANWIIQNIESLKARSIRENVIYTLHIGIDSGTFQVESGEPPDSRETLPGAEGSSGENSAFQLPDSVRIVDIQLPGAKTRTVGKVSLQFSPAGYSDFALIHLRNDRGEYRSFWVQPFLPHVIYSESHADIKG